MPLKYPLILVHGVGAKDSKLFWGRIPDRLRKKGVPTYLGNTDSWGSIESNAHFLAQTIDKVLELTQSDKVNIIAHSKGGIDSRYLICQLGYASRVASLITISTPHQGSELVDLIYSQKQIYNPLVKQIAYTIGKLYGDKSPDPYAIISQLSTANMKLFNEDNPNHPNIYYSSFHSVLRNQWDDISVFFPLYAKVAGENDGIVSLKSAQWGKKFTLISGKRNGISHSEIVDIKRKHISGIDILAIYEKIVEKLERLGL